MKSYNKSNICFYAFDCLNMNGEVIKIVKMVKLRILQRF